MTLPPLTPGTLRQLSPEGRLERQEAILARVTGEIPEEELETYRRHVEVARANWERDSFTARLYLEKAEHALTDLQWRRSAEVATGSKLLDAAKASADAKRGKMSEDSKMIIREMQRLVDQGHSIRSAARCVGNLSRMGSAEANSKLWHRWKKKMGTLA